MTPRLKPAVKSPMMAPQIFQTLERAKSHYDDGPDFLINSSILNVENDNFYDEFEASLPAKSELKFDLLKIESQDPRQEDQEIRDRLRSIQSFNNLEPQLGFND